MKKLVLVVLFLICIGNTKAQHLFRPGTFQTELIFGGSKSKGDLNSSGFLAELIFGIRPNPYFFFGLGYNAHLLYSDNKELPTMSFMANFKTYLPFIHEKIHPFASLNVGYAIGFVDLLGYGGLYLAPGIGVNYQLYHFLSFFAMGSYDKLYLSHKDNKLNGHYLGIRGGLTLIF